ncbi:MAG TPA: glycosyltransferase family 4 protein [Lacunisphaera sp.]|nr:glycosyltransferase family 4 protein [Lacunisphaera sp.]
MVVIVNRQSLLGTASDCVLLLWFLLRQKRVWLYFHNQSWRRYARYPLALVRWLGGDSLRMLVLTSEIAKRLRDAGFDSRVLNNSGGEAFDALAARSGPPGARRLVWIGRPDKSKGFTFALEVFAALRSSESGWWFDIYGTEGKGHDQPPGVFYHGFVQGPEKMRAYLNGGVFILPSSYVNETQPLAIIEALAAGLPVVASTAGGIKEMLRAGEKMAGYAIPEQSIAEYVHAINSCIAHYKECSSAAKVVYRQRFSHRGFCHAVATEFAIDSLSTDDRQSWGD